MSRSVGDSPGTVAAAAWQQLDANRRQLRAEQALAGQERAAERFARAVDQLGSDRLEVRLGGIYGLEGVAASAATPLDLSGSLLPGARLDRARLAGADLRGADVRATSLQHADLAGARLVEVCQA